MIKEKIHKNLDICLFSFCKLFEEALIYVIMTFIKAFIRRLIVLLGVCTMNKESTPWNIDTNILFSFLLFLFH